VETTIDCSTCTQLKRENQNIQTQNNAKISSLEEELKQIYDEINQKIAENTELADKVKKLEIKNTSSSSPSYQCRCQSNPILDFDLYLPFEQVRNHMMLIFNKNKGLGKVSFHGRLNLRTGKVISSSIESMTEDDIGNDKDGRIW
jgi:hypothetical protein